MAKYSYTDELYQAYTTEKEARHERYRQNVRAVCARSGGYARYKRDGEKYFRNRWANKKNSSAGFFFNWMRYGHRVRSGLFLTGRLLVCGILITSAAEKAR